MVIDVADSMPRAHAMHKRKVGDLHFMNPTRFQLHRKERDNELCGK